MATTRPSSSLTCSSTDSHRHGTCNTLWALFVCLVVVSFLSLIHVVGAFVLTSPPLPAAVQVVVPSWCRLRSRSSFALFLSSPSSSLTPDEEDEIAKLVGKRNQIKRKTREPDPRQADLILEGRRGEPPAAAAAAAAAAGGEEEATALVDLDLDKLPEFKIERPIRRAAPSSSSKEDDSDSNAAKSKKKQEAALPIVDFKADHEDENDLLHIPNRIGITTSSWGDTSRNFVPSGKLTKSMIKAGKFVPGDLQTAYTKLLERGVTFMETSPTYGAASRPNNLSALDILKRCLEEQTDELPECILCNSLLGSTTTTTTTAAWTMMTKLLLPSSSRRMTQSLYDAVERLGTSSVELFTIPKSFLFPTSSVIVNALTMAIESGCCNNVGVQGVTRASTLRKLIAKLADRDVTLVTNAFEYSLTNTRHEEMISVCKELNVIPIILNPFDGGLASGVYTATNPSGGQAGGGTSSSGNTGTGGGNSASKFTFAQLEKLQPLHSVQETVAERVRTRVIREMQSLQDRVKGGGKKASYGPPPKINTDITTTQIAINYVIAKGGVPLVEVNSPRQADEVLGSLGWTLSDDEVDMLDAAAALCKLSRK